MPNIVKYSTGSESQSLKKNNFYIGLGDVGKGPTSNSGFYNGYVPPSGGYTIYLNKASGGPSIYTCSSSSELIALTNKISGQNFSTIYQCFTWFQNQSDKMIVNRDYEGIITNGLDMHVDAGFVPSYPQTGTTLLNVTYSATTGELYNGVSWVDDGVGGAFSYDGANDAITLNYSSVDFRYLNQSFSLCVWAKKNQTAPGSALMLRGNYQAGGAWSFGFNNGTGIQFFTSRDNPSSTQTSISNIISNNAWYYVVVTFDQVNATCKLYCNGTDVTSTPVTMQIPNANAYPVCFNLGLYNCISGGYKEYYNGYIAMASSYGRLLTASEVLQNYQATLPRFVGGNILTNGLILYLDAGYRASYPTTGTKWSDVSGNNNNGTLINGPTFNTGNTGNIVFDGSDDLVNCGNSTSILSITNQLTFGGFVKFSTFGNYRRFIFKDNGTEGAFESFYNPNVNKFDFEIVTSGGRTSVKSTTTPSTNTIYYLVGTYDGSNMKIYINGVLENTTSKTGNITIGPGGGLFLGNTNGGANPYSFYLNGSIYNVQVYNRALSDSEVLQNYNAQKGRFGL